MRTIAYDVISVNVFPPTLMRILPKKNGLTGPSYTTKSGFCVFWANPKTDHESIKSTPRVDSSDQIQIRIFEIHNLSVFWKGFEKYF